MIRIKEVKNRCLISKNFIRDSYWGIDSVIKLLERDKHVRKYLKVREFDIKIKTQKNSIFISNYKNNNGKCKCDICGLEGKYFALERVKNTDSLNTYHFNLYTIDPNNKVEIYFNIDHIKPKSKGGTNIQSNLQLTCHVCNTIKGNSYQGGEKTKPSTLEKILVLIKKVIK